MSQSRAERESEREREEKPAQRNSGTGSERAPEWDGDHERASTDHSTLHARPPNPLPRPRILVKRVPWPGCGNFAIGQGWARRRGRGGCLCPIRPWHRCAPCIVLRLPACRRRRLSSRGSAACVDLLSETALQTHQCTNTQGGRAHRGRTRRDGVELFASLTAPAGTQLTAPLSLRLPLQTRPPPCLSALQSAAAPRPNRLSLTTQLQLAGQGYLPCRWSLRDE